ncbi:small subunit ribosomal protein S1 [Mobilisporobacter senegalensis]|uniref:Small subunit ribosomal protein S1 n=1 Tax=Mobilisporobacter senegalensis TaxID=1329262 RepID=A0A3N1XFB3_9FIRM|nr:S1 RNA-binding domain-containing protein [Mobilisporobacter senegalensis]ROR23692.1 small subunit ribosomal protein S1 [Mobilisporobacter senegalensis]
MNEENKDVAVEKEEVVEIIPSMDEFKEELENSFHKISEGDIIKGTVIGVSDTEVTLDLRYYTEGIIKLEELSNDPRFSIKADIKIGDEISAEVIREDDGRGNILLSKKRADNVLAWDILKDALNNRTKYNVKIASEVKGGVVTYLEGIRGFIPASALSLNYVEDLSSYVGKTLEVIVITADEANNKLVLSGKEVEREKELADKNSKISKLQRGLVTKGTVEKITPYGAFINIGDGLSGLVHISQICGRRIKSPNEVLKEGEEVTVKIIDIKDGKVSLSIKAATEEEDVIEDVSSAPMEYSSGEEASTGLGSLLANIKL